jgi:hypothetical protein
MTCGRTGSGDAENLSVNISIVNQLIGAGVAISRRAPG